MNASKKIKRLAYFLQSFALWCVLFSSSAFAQSASGPMSFNLGGGLFNPNGTPVLNPSVDFKVEVLDPSGACVLYSEEHIGVNLQSSKGGFALQVGTGANRSNLIDVPNATALSLKIFKNDGLVTPSMPTCPGLTLVTGQTRLIRVSFNTGGGYTAMTPDVPITSASYAMIAETLEGKHASDFIQVRNDGTHQLTQTNIESLFENTAFGRLSNILQGSAPTDPGHAVTKGYADANVAGKNADVSALGPATGGYILAWDAVTSKWVAQAPNTMDSTKLPLAGGSMSGGINMGGNEITSVGDVFLAVQKFLGLGKFTNTQEGALTLGTADSGRVWYNSDENVLKVWNGTAAMKQAYLVNDKLQPTWIADNSIKTRNVASSVLDNQLLITGGTMGADIEYASCGENEVLKYNTMTGWTCANVSSLSSFPVTSVNGKTGAVVLNAADLNLGTASLEDVGSNAGDIPQLDAGARIPSIFMPTNMGDIQSITVSGPLTGGGLSGAISIGIDVGTGASQVVQMTGSGKLPAVDGSDLTQVNAVKLQTRDVSAVAPAGGQVLTYNGSTNAWEPRTDSGTGTVTTIVGGTGLNGGTITSTGTLSVNVGTGANQIVQMTASAKLPAVDGSDLTGVNAVKLQTRDVSAAAPAGGQLLVYNGTTNVWEPRTDTGTGTVSQIVATGGILGGTITATGTISVDTGTLANQIVQMTGSQRLPAVDGRDLTNINAVKLQTRDVAATAPSANQVLTYNGTTNTWEPRSDAGGSVTTIVGGTGLNGGTITSTGTLSVNVGTGANQVVQLDGSARLQALDGRNLTNVNAVKLQTYDVAATAPGANQVLTWNSVASQWQPLALPAGNIGDVTEVAVTSGLTGGGTVGALTIGIDAGTLANQMVRMTASAKLPGVDGSDLTGVNAVKLQTRDVAATAPGAGQVLTYNGSTNMWEPRSDAGGSVTQIVATGGILGGTISSSGTISVDTGTLANQIVQMTASQRLPAVDGRDLTNINAVKIQTRDISAAAPGAGQVLAYNGTTNVWEPKSDAGGSVTTIVGGTGLNGGTITSTGTLSVNVGTGANQVVQLDGSARIPAVDGRNLYNVNASALQSYQVASSAPSNAQVLTWNGASSQWQPLALPAGNIGDVTEVVVTSGLTGGGSAGALTIGIDAGTSANQIVRMTALAKLPGVDGSDLTGVNAVKLQTRDISAAAPGGGQVLTYNGSTNVWEPRTDTGTGTVTQIVASTGLNGGTITSNGTISVNVGTLANQIVQLDGSARVPAVDGRNLYNVNAAALQSYQVAATAPSNAQVLTWNSSTSLWQPLALPAGNAGDVTEVAVSSGLTGGGSSGNLTIGIDAGTGANQMVRMTASAKLPAVDGGDLTGVNAVRLQARNVSAVAPTAGQVLAFNGLSSAWEAKTDTGTGTVTQIVASTGLNGGTITSNGTISVNVGTLANQIVQLDGSARLPALDGRNLTTVDATTIRSFNVAATTPANAQVMTWNSSASQWQPLALPAGNAGDVTEVAVTSGLTGGGTAGNLTIGIDAGTAANQMVRMTASARLPSVDGRDLLNINAATLQSYPVAATAPGNAQVLTWNGSTSVWQPLALPAGNAGDVTEVAVTSGLTGGGAAGALTIGIDAGTSANQIVRMTASAKLPAVDGGDVLNVNAVRLQARNVSATAPTAGQVLAYNGSSSAWEPKTDSAMGTVTQIVASTGLTGGTITGSGTLAVNVGTLANQIVQLDGSARIPALDGRQLTNVDATTIRSFNVAATAPSNAQVMTWNSSASQWQPLALPAGNAGDVTEVAVTSGLTGGGAAGALTIGIDAGTGANQIVRMTASARLPVVDGRDLYNVNASTLQSYQVAATAPGNAQVLTWNGSTSVWQPLALPAGNTGDVTEVAVTSGLTGGGFAGALTIGIDAGTSANQMVRMTASAKLPAVDGGDLLNVNAVRLQARAVSSTAPTSGQVLAYNGLSSVWEARTDSGTGTVTQIVASTGLNGGTITSNGTISVNVGTAANQIVQLDGSARLPVVDGRNLTNLNSVQLQTYNVAATSPANAQVLTWNGSASQWQPLALPAGNAGDVTEVAVTSGLTGGGVAGALTIGIDAGTAANQMVRMTASARLPAVDGRDLLAVNAATLQSYQVSATAPSNAQVLTWNGTTSVWQAATLPAGSTGDVTEVAVTSGLTGGGLAGALTIGIDAGTSANQIVRMTASAKLPAVDGGDLINVNATRLQTRNVSATAPTGGQVLAYNGTSSVWEPKTDSAMGTVTQIVASTGLNGGTITSNGTISVNVGTLANQIVQLDGTARLPAVDGRNLTNINSTQLQSRTLAATAPTANQVITWNGLTSAWEPQSPAAGVTVAGSADGQLQFKSGSSLAASPALSWSNANSQLVVNGNVAFGTTATNARLEIQSTAVASSRESPLRASISDASGDVFGVKNSTTSNGLFAPAFYGVHQTSALHPGLVFQGMTTAARDSGDMPLTLFISQIASGDPVDGAFANVNVRPAFGFSNANNRIMTLHNDGAVTIGTTVAASKLTLDGSLTLAQQSSDPSGRATYGALYTKSDGKLYYKNGTTAGVEVSTGNATQLQSRTVAATAPTASQVLTWNNQLSHWEPQSTAAGVTVAGSGGEIQFNSGSGLGASANLNWNNTTSKFSATNIETTSLAVTKLGATTSLVTLTGQNSGIVDDTTGISLYIEPRPSGTITNGIGIKSTVQNGNLTNVGTLAGAQILSYAGSGNVTHAYGIQAVTDRISGVSTTTNAYAGHFKVNRQAGTVTNGYGVYIDDTVASVEYGLYQAGATDKNYFAGNVGLGTTAPNARLTVNGAIGLAHQSSDAAGAANFGTLYTRADGILYYRNGTGTIADISSGARLQTRAVASTSPTDSQVLAWNGSLSQWEPQAPAAGLAVSGSTEGLIQFKSGTSLGSHPNLVWNNSMSRLGIGSIVTPDAKVEIRTFAGQPATSGSVQAAGALRLSQTTGNMVLDMGVSASNQHTWLQATHQGDLSQKYTIALNPNGGTVTVGYNNNNTNLEVVGAAQLAQRPSDPAGIAAYGSLYTKSDGKLYYRDGIGAIANVITSTSTPTAGQVLTWNGTASAWQALASSGGNPSGSDGELQFKSGTSFAASSNLSWNSSISAIQANRVIVAGGTVAAPGLAFANSPNSGLIYSGSAVTIVENGTGSMSFDDLAMQGTGANGTIRVLRYPGTASSPTYTFKSWSDTGMFAPNDDLLAFATAGSERLRIDASGNIGLGTTLPNANLTLTGAMSFNHLFTNATGAAGFGTVFAKNDGKLYFRNGTGTISDLTASGASPAGSDGELQFKNGSALAASSNLSFNSTTANLSVGNGTGGSGLTVNAPSLVMNFDYGNAALDINANHNTNGQAQVWLYSGTGASRKVGLMNLTRDGMYVGGRGDNGGLPLFLTTNSQERLAITNAGNVGIGTTLPKSALDVVGGLAIGNYAGTNPAPANGLMVSGTVGIGTTFPLAKVEIRGTQGGNANFGAGRGSASGVLVSSESPGGDGPIIGLTIANGGENASSPLGWFFNLIGVNTYYDATTNTLRRNNVTGGFTAAQAITMTADNGQIGGGRLGIWTGNGDPVERVSITNSGNVGIGATLPNAMLTLGGAMSFNHLYADAAGASGFGTLYTKTDGKLYFKNGTGTATDLTAGGGSPAGSDGQLQFKSGTAFAASSHLAWNSTKTQLLVTATSSDASAPTYSFVNDPNTGMYSNVTDELSFTAGGNQRMTLRANDIYFTAPFTVFDWDGTLYTPTGSSAYPAGYNLFANTNLGAGNTAGFALSVGSGGDLHAAYLGVVHPASGVTPDIVIGQQTSTSAYTERIRINSNGNVGIGTTLPVVPMDIQRSSASIATLLKLENGTNGTDRGPAMEFTNTALGTGSTLARIAGGGDRSLRFYTGDSWSSYLEHMRINTNGDVGIGTTVPNAQLELTSTTEQLRVSFNSTNYMSVTVDNGANAVFDTSGGTITFADDFIAPVGFRTNATQASSNMWVGHGTAITSGVSLTQAQLAGSTNVQLRILERGSSSNTLSNGHAYASHIIGTQALTEGGGLTHPLLAQFAVKPLAVTAGVATVTNAATVYIEDASNAVAIGNYALWVDNGAARFDGDVGIGTSLPSYKLQVADAVADYLAFFQQTAGTSGGDGILIRAGANNLPGTSTVYVGFQDGDGTDVGSITANSTGGVVYNTTSDRRIKRNIRDTHFSIEDIMRLRVRDYNPVNSNREVTGYVAQELYEVYPEAVTPGDENKIWQVDYSKMTPLLTKGIQDLYGMCKASDDQLQRLAKQVQANERRLANVEQENAELKKTVNELKNELEEIKAMLKKRK